jgi:hypothetical protein
MPQQGFEENPVAKRASFANSGMLRYDSVFKEGAVQRRIIIYPTPPREVKPLRDRLIEQGLVLGQLLEDQGDGQDRFMVPVSARPLSHEAASESTGPYDYSDSDLFHDLGKLLGNVAASGPESPVLLNESLGQNVAIVAFTRPDEPSILLVPGFELAAVPMADDDAISQAYGTLLYNEFGSMFERQAQQFMDVFRSVG